MSSVQTTASTPRSARINKIVTTILLIVGAVVLAAGISFFVYDRVSSSGSSASPTATPQASSQNQPVPKHSTPVKPKSVHVSYAHLSPQIHAVVRKFVMTAVARKNAGASWSITAPSLRQGFSRKAWATGTTPVVYFPFDHFISGTFKVTGYTPREITLIMGLFPTARSHSKPLTFMMGLHKFGSGPHARWLVDYWNAHWTPQVPYAAP